MAHVGDTTVYVGSPQFFTSQLHVALDGREADVRRLQEEGKTVVLVGTLDVAWGAIAIRDNVRPNAARAIAALHTVGIRKVVMLTGDNERTAKAIAGRLG